MPGPSRSTRESDAASVVVFLHGLGRGLRQGEDVARQLRGAGLASNVSIVIVRAPYRFGLFGFSWGDRQGATLALDTAADEPRIGAVASLSPCCSEYRGHLPSRDLRFLLAHGALDAKCPVEESRSPAKVLKSMNKPVRYIEFDGKHEIPREVIKALVTFAIP